MKIVDFSLISSGETSFLCAEEDFGNTFSDNTSLEAHQDVHSNLTNLCPECGQVYKVTIKKHKCKIETECSGGELVPQLPSPPSPPQQQQQQLQQFQFNQQHNYLSSGHHHETVGPVNIQVHSLPDPPQQHEQTHFVLTPTATIQQGLPQTMQNFQSLSAIPSSSASFRSYISSHTIPHLTSPAPTNHPSHIMQSPTQRTTLQSEEWQSNFKQSIPQPSQLQFQQHCKYV